MKPPHERGAHPPEPGRPGKNAARPPAEGDEARHPHDQSAHRRHALDENVDAIRGWEEAALHSRSRAEELSEAIIRIAGSGAVLLAHVVWFGLWIVVNLHGVSFIRPFDEFPFPLLTTVVSLEAIFLSLFVLASQNRLSHQQDKRAHLDLQIDLLAEREMTVVVRLLQDIIRHLDIRPSVTAEQIRDLAKNTDIHALTDRLDEIAEPANGTKHGAPPAPGESKLPRRKE